MIHIILDHPSHPGNIGAVARAMHTMDIDHLRLVAPKVFPSEEATARATAAAPILDKAPVYDQLSDALSDMHMVYATSGRHRYHDMISMSPREAADEIATLKDKKVGILFGNEAHGLLKDDLLLANRIICIETSENQHSLNLSHAVQIIAYECFCALKTPGQPLVRDLANHERIATHIDFWQQIITKLKQFNPQNPGQTLKLIRQWISRSPLSVREADLLNGLLKTILKHLHHDG